MDYRMLGKTGLKVSAFSFGFYATFGVKEGIDRALSILEICRQNGINFYDNAEVYGTNRGDAELIMGEAMAQLQLNSPHEWRRSDLVISSKIYWGGDGQNEKGVVHCSFFLIFFLNHIKMNCNRVVTKAHNRRGRRLFGQTANGLSGCCVLSSC